VVAAMHGDDPDEHLRFALDLLPMIPEASAAVVQGRAGFAYFYARRAYEAEQHSLQALWVSQSNGMHALAARTASIMYTVHYHLTGDLQAARYYAEVLGVEAVAAGDREARRLSLIQQYDLAATFGEWDRARSLRTLLRRDATLDSYGYEFTMRVSDCLMHGNVGDFPAMRGLAETMFAGTKETADFALLYALKAIAFAGLDADADARREARRALGLSREQHEMAILTIRRRLAAVLAGYACILIGDVVRGQRTLSAAAKGSGAIGLLGQILSRAGLQADVPDINNPNLRSVRGYAMVAAAARHARARAVNRENKGIQTLTDIELVLLRSAANGKTNGEIARERGVTRNAVERRLMSAYGKLGVRTRAEAIAKIGALKT